MIFQSDRLFGVYSFIAEHGCLLIRSRPVISGSRTDILFKDVRAIEMRFLFDGFTIRKGSIEDLAAKSSSPGALMEPGLTVYNLEGADWTGYIIGGVVQVDETVGGWSEPTKLLPLELWNRIPRVI